MADGQETNKIDEVDGRKNERSTIEFPYMPLETAEEVARAVYSRSGFGTCELDELAAEMDQTMSGAFRQKTSAAKTFGVVDKDGRSAFKLTDLGRRIIDDSSSAAARVEAFLAVPLYLAIYEKYRGQKLPPAKALEREMQSVGVSSKQTDRARQAFERSAHYAGFFSSGTDRLVRPKIEGAPLDSVSSQPPSSSGDPNSGSGGQTHKRMPPQILNVDPIIQGLIDRLPAAGSRWSKNKRKLWLQILENSFDLVYEDGADDPES